MTLYDYMLDGKFVPYDEESKSLFRKLGKEFLEKAREFIGSGSAETSLKYNAGGIAVSGDFSLYVMFNDNKGACVFFNADFPFVTMRTIKHVKDYSGGMNRTYQLSTLKDPEALAVELRKVAEKER